MSPAAINLKQPMKVVFHLESEKRLFILGYTVQYFFVS